jgi:hypothetical protein
MVVANPTCKPTQVIARGQKRVLKYQPTHVFIGVED